MLDPIESAAEAATRQEAIDIWQAGVDAVRADRLVRERVRIQSGRLLITAQDRSVLDIDLAPIRRVCIVGGGKAAAGMTSELERALAAHFSTPNALFGHVNIPNGTAAPTDWVDLLECRPQGCNEPTEAAEEGAEKILQLVSRLGQRDLCVVVLTGGGSALLPLPSPGITLEDKIDVTRFLSAAGADIRQLNAVRRNLSRLKGGRLAVACGASRIVTLILSDVLGDRLESIASGPTVPANDGELARATLAQFDPQRSEVSDRVWRQIERNASAPPPSIKAHVDHVVLANNATAVDAAMQAAQQRGYATQQTPTPIPQPSASALGVELARTYDDLSQGAGKQAVISGGEPSVELAPAEQRGTGGRNQQAILEALVQLAKEADETKVNKRRDRSVVLLSAGTDGEDGPTEAAGACASGTHVNATRRLLTQARAALERNDAYPVLGQMGALLTTGPTGTNVCDLRVCLSTAVAD